VPKFERTGARVTRDVRIERNATVVGMSKSRTGLHLISLTWSCWYGIVDGSCVSQVLGMGKKYIVVVLGPANARRAHDCVRMGERKVSITI
jgi:hypothetical protein